MALSDEEREEERKGESGLKKRDGGRWNLVAINMRGPPERNLCPGSG